MEPIRPDDDELRADRPSGHADRKKAAPGKAGGASARQKPSPKRAEPASGSRDGRGRSSVSLLWLMLIGFACLAIAGWYSQNQRVQALEGQLEEADYWARQSKLALARFEGDLSETGESLQQRGASLAEQMAANKKLLDTANSEIRKLWVVANERNKERLNKHQERLTAVEKDLAEEKQALVALSTSVEKLRSSFSADLAALQEQTQTSVSALQDADRQAADQLMGLSKKVGDVESLIDGKIRRFEQEQKLGIKGMESRITALEKAAGGDSQFQALQEELNRLKSTVQAIDSSRAQLTSRLVRLSDEVNALRSKQ